MDSQLVAKKILTAFMKSEVRYALMGGVALGIWGVHRANLDWNLVKDMKQVEANRDNPFVVKGQVDIDRWITFLTEYNEFINHARKLFRPMVEKDIRL